MGTRLKDPSYPFADDCEACVPPAGDLWSAGETPKHVYATFMLMDPCSNFEGVLPNGISFKLTQDDGMKCWWDGGTDDFVIRFVSFDAFTNRSSLRMDHSDGHFMFQSDLPICPFEYRGFENIILTCPNHVYARNGYGIVSWNEIPLKLVEWFGLQHSPRLMLEQFFHEDGDRVVKFCDKRDATNIKIKFTP